MLGSIPRSHTRAIVNRLCERLDPVLRDQWHALLSAVEQAHPRYAALLHVQDEASRARSGFMAGLRHEAGVPKAGCIVARRRQARKSDHGQGR